MNYIVQFQINIFAFLVLTLIFLIIETKSKVKSFGKKLLKALMIIAAFAIVIEPLNWIFEESSLKYAYTLKYITNTILLMLGPCMTGLMISYVNYHIFKDPKEIYKKRFYQDFAIINALILIINVFYPFYFKVDKISYKYISLKFNWVYYASILMFYFYMIAILIKNRKNIPAYISRLFLLFFAMPMIGMMLQAVEPKLYFTWTSTVISALAVYIFLESGTTEKDFLTNLYRRQSYDMHITHLIEMQKSFSIIMLDLNHFKQINDIYGHHKGDQVLVAFANALDKSFKTQSDPLVSRLGGDEFIVVSNILEVELESYMDKIYLMLGKSSDEVIRSLTFSYGYQEYLNDMTADEIYTLADKKMYENKMIGRA